MSAGVWLYICVNVCIERLMYSSCIYDVILVESIFFKVYIHM